MKFRENSSKANSKNFHLDIFALNFSLFQLFLFFLSCTSRFSGFIATKTRKHKEKALLFHRNEETKTWLHASGCDCDFIAQVHRLHPEKVEWVMKAPFAESTFGFVVWESASGFEGKWKEAKNRDNISQASLEGFVFVRFQSCTPRCEFDL